MSLRCENCGASYKGPISPYTRFVKCEYCGNVINVSENKSRTQPIVKPVAVYEEPGSARKTFSLEGFNSFLVRKGVKTFDSVSGILRLGNQEAIVYEDGAVSGPEPLRSRVERWVHEFMLL